MLKFYFLAVIDISVKGSAFIRLLPNKHTFHAVTAHIWIPDCDFWKARHHWVTWCFWGIIEYHFRSNFYFYYYLSRCLSWIAGKLNAGVWFGHIRGVELLLIKWILLWETFQTLRQIFNWQNFQILGHIWGREVFL